MLALLPATLLVEDDLLVRPRLEDAAVPRGPEVVLHAVGLVGAEAAVLRTAARAGGHSYLLGFFVFPMKTKHIVNHSSEKKSSVRWQNC